MILALLVTWLLLSVLVSLFLGRAMSLGGEARASSARSVGRLDHAAAA